MAERSNAAVLKTVEL